MHPEVVKEAISKYGTPLYLLDGKKIEQQYTSLKNSLPEGFEILYSMKANPLVGICQLLKSLGSKVEVASMGELYTAVFAGFSVDDIVFTSPGKTPEEIEFAIKKGIYCINIESIKEAELINEYAGKHSKRIRVAVRVNPDFNYSHSNIKMGGISTQFGIDQSKLEEAFSRMEKLTNIKVAGIHIYNATQILEADNIVSNSEDIMKLALQLSDKYHFQLEFLDMGGGFGIPYFENESPLDLKRLKHGMEKPWSQYGSRFSNTRILVESGRYLTAEAGVFITKILYTKDCKSKRYYVCDAGYSQHPSATFLGRYNKNRFSVKTLHQCSEKEKATLVGPTCTPIDILAEAVNIGTSNTGDYIMLENSGAYGLTNSPTMFLSHPCPAEVIYYDEKLHLLRARGTVEDMLNNQNKLFL